MIKHTWSRFLNKLGNSHPCQVLLAGFVSFFLATIFLNPHFYKRYLGLEHVDIISGDYSENKMIWTLMSAIVSAPIAFVIWRLRDKNASQQIEHARKDINLKEFQKLAEWISGANLVENKIIKDFEKETLEFSRPYLHSPILTYSKMNGAIALQIAAIYNLLPFYRGEHGESFRRPSLNLLKTAWLALQAEDIRSLEKLELSSSYYYGEHGYPKNRDEAQLLFDRIKQNANSEIGKAITQVMLSDGGDNLIRYPEEIHNICLAGMNFNLYGLEYAKLRNIFQSNNLNLDGVKLYAANLDNFNFNKLHLDNTLFWGASLEKASFQNAEISVDNLRYANLAWANLINIDMQDVSSKRLDSPSFDLSLFSEPTLGTLIAEDDILIFVENENYEDVSLIEKTLLNNRFIIVSGCSKENIMNKLDISIKITAYNYKSDLYIYNYEIDQEKTQRLNKEYDITFIDYR
ncbi:TPA: pentapeptide repeat-containing protein [Mannheimia haemolytica]